MLNNDLVNLVSHTSITRAPYFLSLTKIRDICIMDLSIYNASASSPSGTIPSDYTPASATSHQILGVNSNNNLVNPSIIINTDGSISLPSINGFVGQACIVYRTA